MVMGRAMSDSPLNLLVFVDASVVADQAPSGLQGSIAIGLTDHDDTRWWTVSLAPRVHTRFGGDIGNPDVRLRMSPDVAEAILAGRPLPEKPNCLELTGDRELFKRFTHRYFGRTDALQLRAGLGRAL